MAFVIVPDPIFARDKGCTLSVERLLPHFELAYFTGTGFPPTAMCLSMANRMASSIR